MGLFTPGYLKPGKGISADEPEKRSFFRFWEIIGEKFSKILGLNIIYVLLSLPFIALMFFIAPIDYEWITTTLSQLDERTASSIYVLLRIIFSVCIFSLFGSGPASAVYAYVIRCFTTRTPVWVISDGKDVFKENFKQSMLLVLIDIIFVVLVPNSIRFYYSLYAQTQNTLFYVAMIVLSVVFIVYTWMHFYIYQLMTTFRLKLRYIFKNALLLTLGSIPVNLIFTAISVGIIFIMFMFLNPIFAILVMCIAAPIFTRMTIEFSATNRIRPIVKKAREQEKESETEES